MVESMALKKPIIGSNIVGVLEVVLDNKTGFILKEYICINFYYIFIKCRLCFFNDKKEKNLCLVIYKLKTPSINENTILLSINR